MFLTKDNLIVLAVVAAIGLGAIFLVYGPQGKKLEELNLQIASLKTELDDKTRKASIVPDMVKQIHEMKNRYKNFDRRLPKQKELGEFLRQISENLSQQKLANQLIEPGNPMREDIYHTLPITMKFEGSYISLANFLKRLESMERLTRVQKLDIRTAPGQSGVSIEMYMDIYFTEG